MEILLALEEKIKSLIVHIKQIQEQLHTIQQDNNSLRIENTELKAEIAKLSESNAQLIGQLNAMENSILLETGHVNELKEERLVTRTVLDDLIKSIDSIVEHEN